VPTVYPLPFNALLLAHVLTAPLLDGSSCPTSLTTVVCAPSSPAYSTAPTRPSPPSVAAPLGRPRLPSCADGHDLPPCRQRPPRRRSPLCVGGRGPFPVSATATPSLLSMAATPPPHWWPRLPTPASGCCPSSPSVALAPPPVEARGSDGFRGPPSVVVDASAARGLGRFRLVVVGR
jgi:hypothetical protein